MHNSVVDVAPMAKSPGADSRLPQVCERLTFPSNLDMDWDVPAFQRRNPTS